MKPQCSLIGVNGNVFSIILHVSNTLKINGNIEEANNFKNEAFKCKKYEDVFAVVDKYVDLV